MRLLLLTCARLDDYKLCYYACHRMHMHSCLSIYMYMCMCSPDLHARLICMCSHTHDVLCSAVQARRQLIFFVNSLHNSELMPAPLVSEMRSFTSMTPHYAEDVTYSLKFMQV